ncbi:MAG: PAS domain-containing protein [Fimbriimonadaceae bacterium]|nr:PAS domain-containing protein [Fimbriimonadaceae bacterium]
MIQANLGKDGRPTDRVEDGCTLSDNELPTGPASLNSACPTAVVREGSVIRVNNAFCVLCGNPDVNHWIGKDIADVLLPSSAPDGSPLPYDRVVRRADGETIEVKAFSLQSTRDKKALFEVMVVESQTFNNLDPAVRHLLERTWDCLEERTLQLDATTRKLDQEQTRHEAAQGALSDNESRYRQLIDLSPNGIMILSRGIIVSPNKTIGALIGLPSSESLIGTNVVDLFDSTSRAEVQAAIDSPETYGRLKEDHQLLCANGETLEVEVYAAAYSGDPEVTSYMIVRDISQRRKAERDLKVAEVRSQFALDASGIGVWDWRPSTNESYYSPTWKAMLGYDDDEITPRHEEWSSRVHPDDWPAIYEAERRLFEGEATHYECIHRLRAKDGTYKWILSRGRPVSYDDDGKPVRYIGTHMDLTDRVSFETQIEELNRNLSARNEELETANSELETFSYTVSHDLRSPLRTIDGYSHAIEYDYGDELSDGPKEYLHAIRRATQKLGHLIDDILSLSRINQSPLRIQNVNLATIAEDIAKDLKSSEKDRKIEFEIESGLMAHGDRNLLFLALQNLMGNAAKFSAKSDPAIITVGKTDGAFFVRDNGVGFNMQHSNKLFEPFQRLHSAQEFEGSGIGLATVARILRRHGGRIWAQSEIGRGATFYFTLGEPES